MWNITKIKVENLFSFSELEYDFIQNQVTTITGLNKDNSGQDSNNAGKSAFAIDCIALGLTGNVIRDLTLSKVVKHKARFGKIHLWLNNPTYNRSLVIERTIYKSTKPSELIISLNNNVVIDSTGGIGTISDGNKLITEEIGISNNDLFNYFIISESKYTSFFHTNNTSREALINRFSNADHIDVGISDLKRDIKDQEKIVEKLELSIQQAESRITFYQTNRDDLKENIKEHQIAELQNRISSNEVSIENHEKQIKKAEKELKELKKQKGFDDLKTVKEQATDVQKIIDNARIKYTQADELLHKVISEKQKLELQEISAIECPSCQHIFNPNDKQEINLEQVKKLIAQYTQEIKETKEIKNSFIGTIDAAIIQLSSIESQETQIRKQIKEKEMRLSYLNNLISTTGEEIVRIKNLNKSITQTIEDYKTDPFAEQRKQLDEKIKEEKELLLNSNLKLQEEKIYLHHLEKSLVYLQKFKTHLANNALDILTAKCNEFMKKIKSDFSIKFLNFKTLASKKQKEEITIQVLDNNQPLDDYNENSKGTLSRVEIGIILAIQSLINQSCNYGGLNLLILDEITLSLDEKGLYSVIDSLAEVDRTIFILTPGKIDHNCNIIQIVRENKNSRINE